ncbi:MAG: AtpZ/AtpI family protein [Patescibacteria group bacterium]|jgi:hypothetical protein
MAEETNPEKPAGRKLSQAAWWQPAVMIVSRLSVWIAAPIIIALYLGKWLDKKYDSAPKLLLLCIGIAFIASMAGLIKNTIAEYKKISELGKSGESDKNK